MPGGRLPPRGEALVVKGWALGTSSPVSSVEIRLGDASLGRAGLGRPRPDVAWALHRDEAELSGFELWPDPSLLEGHAGDATLRARVVLLDGTQAELPPVEARVGPPPPRSPARSPEEAVFPSEPPSSRAPASGLLRILWFERALGRGGSQLRLRELVERLATTGDVESTVIADSEGPLRGVLEKAGARVEVPGPFPLGDLVAYEAHMARLLASVRGRFDLVVGHTLTSFPAIDLARRLGLPSIWRIGEAEALSTVVGWLYGRLDPGVETRARRAFADASTVLFNSDAALRVQRRAGASGRFVVLKTGVDVAGAKAYAATMNRERCRRELGIAHDQRLLVCTATLWPVKGQALLASALHQCQGRRLACALVGDATEPYAGALSRFVAHHGLRDSVRVLPFVADLRPWLRAADVAVCASESESLPASVLEAMAFGLPVLAPRVGDLAELVEPGVTGWLCEPRDLGSLIAGLEQVAAASQEELQRLGTAAEGRVAAAHDRGVVLRHTAELIRAVSLGST